MAVTAQCIGYADFRLTLTPLPGQPPAVVQRQRQTAPSRPPGYPAPTFQCHGKPSASSGADSACLIEWNNKNNIRSHQRKTLGVAWLLYLQSR